MTHTHVATEFNTTLNALVTKEVAEEESLGSVNITPGADVDILTLPSLPAGSNVIGGVTQSGSWTFGGPVAVGSPVSGNSPILIGGSDGTNARFLRTDSNGYQLAMITNGTQNMPTMDAVARRGFVTITDGTNSMPTADTVARAMYHRITDGTNQAAVKAASTAAAASDPALVVSVSPNMVATSYSLSAAASTNATSVKASAGTLFTIICSNTAASTNYLKFYNKASAPTVGTDVPVLTIAIATNQTIALQLGTLGYRFTTGIAIATTVNAVDSDTTVLAAANTLKIALSYN